MNNIKSMNSLESIKLNTRAGQRLLILICKASNVKTAMDRMSYGMCDESELNQKLEDVNRDVAEFSADYNQDVDDVIEFLESYAIMVD